MDDILVLSPTIWRLRKAVTAGNRVLGSLRLDKTFIGRTERGFNLRSLQPEGLDCGQGELPGDIGWEH
jgi:hypothetical protein